MRNLWGECQFKWLLADGLKLAAPQATTIPLAMGSAWHRLMDVWWAGDVSDGHRFKPDCLNFRESNARWALADWYHVQKAKLDGFSTDAQPAFDADSLLESMVLLYDMLKAYTQQWSSSLWDVVATELSVERYLPTPSGHRSQILDEVRLDKLVRDTSGQHWLVEHKTTQDDLNTWIEHNTYRPQAAAYASAIEDHLGIQVAGVIYDLARKSRAHTPDTWDVLKSGKALAKPKSGKAPSTLTAHEFENILAFHGFPLDGEGSQDWYRPVLEQCQRREAAHGHPRVRRHIYRFAPGETQLVALEQYAMGVDIRRARKLLDRPTQSTLYHLRRKLDVATDPDEVADIQQQWATAAATEVKRIGHLFPRCQASCWKWSRPCIYMDACQFRSVESMSGLRLRHSRPEETADESDGDV